ncbi:oxaloacetate tautomerase fahd2, mitochondrial-like [Antedon mediterranea]|uniref:oxaloacetate tautomerase fahd2, mitochondrial-like n=1 Tax=Antedon mediterranea TaxID=105859 RepID=UPI003AF46338
MFSLLIKHSVKVLCRPNVQCVSFQTRQFNEKMRFVQFASDNGKESVGVELENGGDVVDLLASGKLQCGNMVEFIKGGQHNLDIAKSIISSGQNVVKRSSIHLLAPITNPEKVLCVGMNYVDHCAEQNQPVPTEPVIFNKFANCIVGPTDNIIYPDITNELDWEVELVIIIGKSCKNVKECDAMDYVFGYTVAHDVSARDWQMKRNGKQWLLGKAMDTFCPLGPAIVTKDSISDPHNLGIRCRVNKETMQDSNTTQLVFKTDAIVAYISQFMTLQAGDLILTGTPPGVGVFRKPNPIFLKRGDVVECEIDEIGTITNKVV